MYAKNGAKVIIASRSLERCDEAVSKIKKSLGKADVEAMKLDLGDLDSVESFVSEFSSKYNRLDILLNNAGVMFTPKMTTKDGFEFQNGINHLGHFALTAKLFPIIKDTKNARIVNVSSIGHTFGNMDWDDYMFEQRYNARLSYGRSKLSNLLFTYELDRRIKEAGLDVKVLAAHPGGSNTNLARYMSGKWWYFLMVPLMLVLAQSAKQGTLPEVRASVDPNAESGQYYGPRGLMESRGLPVLVQSNQASHNKEDQKKLWEVSETLTGVEFNV
jgi:NAD(P)-dependent dehydrogenase (short-subunit alcohol dehydrogenase family)